MRILLFWMCFMLLASYASAQEGRPSTDEYNNVKPGLLSPDMRDQQPQFADDSAEQNNLFTTNEQSTMTIEDIVAAHQQGKFELILPSLTILAKHGHHRAEELLGLMYKSGQGVQKNSETALMWLTKAAEAKQPLAQHHLGVMYFAGEAVPADQAKALMWLRLAMLYYPEGAGKKRATEDHDNLAAQSTRRNRERSMEFVREWLDKRGDKRLLDAQ